MRIKEIFRNIKNNIVPYFTLPHIWILIFITILTIITFVLSVVFRDTKPFTTSILSNISCGLLTGVIFCLITTIKAISLYKTEQLLSWLNDLHNDCLKFREMYSKIKFCKSGDFDNIDTFWDYVYDTLTVGNDVGYKINSERYNKNLTFNSYKYCKTKFDFDSIKFIEDNERTKETVAKLYLTNITQSELRNIFKDIDNKINELNYSILSQITDLEIKKKIINLSIG